MIRMDIETVVVGGGPVSSLVVLRPHDQRDVHDIGALPIRIGAVEASAIGMGVNRGTADRPMTHDLLSSVITSLGAQVKSICIVAVKGTTFFAQVNLTSSDGSTVQVDARPSDAIALAVRTKAPIFASDSVMRTASCPDFHAVKEDEEKREEEEFHEFVENLSPDDFSAAGQSK